MLVVTNGTESKVVLESNYEKNEEQNGVALQISFSSFYFPENVGHEILDFEVHILDEDGHEYKVKQFKQVEFEKQITATHIFFDLCHNFKYDIYGGTHTFEEFSTWLFEGTGWKIENIDVDGSQVIPNFGNNNVLQLINILRDAYKCEYKILPNKTIQFGKIIGKDNNLQYRYKYNIGQLTQSIDTTSLKTQIRGIGGNGVAVTYTSPLASNPLIGIRVAETFEDGTIATEEEMIEKLKEQLNDVPETIIEISLAKVNGNVGDYVWIIHEKMNLEYQTRIISKKTTRNIVDSTITVGNTVRKDITDVLVSQRANIEEHKKITRSKFEQTNELIAMEVETLNESIAQIAIKGSEEIEARVMDKVNDEFAAINLRADTIESTVQGFEGDISRIEQTAEQLRSTVEGFDGDISRIEQTAQRVESTVQGQETIIDDLGTRVSSAESTVTQAAAQVSSKVSYSDFTGETITSMINQTPDTVTIDASKINLRGTVTVLSDISNNLGNITAGNIDLYSDVKVGDKIYLNGGSGSGVYFDRFGSRGKIYTDGNTMHIYSDAMVINTMYGANVVNGMRITGGLWVDGVQVTGGSSSSSSGNYPTTRTSGLSFGFSIASKRLYVGLYGSDYGYIQLT